MNIIAAVDKNWGIGFENKLLVRIPADMRNFKNVTIGKTVIMGRKTLESFPEQKPLNDRTNIVITKKDLEIEGAVVVHSVEEALGAVSTLRTQEVFVIGGQSIYEQMLPFCDTAYITLIDHAYAADAYFPNLDINEEWMIAKESEEQTFHDLEYSFVKYKRK